MPNAPDPNAAPPALELTDEHLDIIDKRMASMLNSTLSNRLGKFEKGIMDKVGEGVAASVAKALEGFKKPEPGADDPDGKGGGKRDKDPDRVKISTLESRLTDLTAKAEASEKRALAERAKNRLAMMRGKAAEALAKATGIEDPVRIKVAMATLQAEGRFKFEDEENDENETVVFVGDDGAPIALDQGLKTWAKGPEAQLLIPAKGTKGAGSRPTGRAGNAGGAPDKQAATDAFWGEVAKVFE